MSESDAPIAGATSGDGMSDAQRRAAARKAKILARGEFSEVGMEEKG